MINSADIQRAYDRLYTAIREYIWGFDVVETLVDLEISCYQTCPDVSEIVRNCERLRLLIQSEMSEDEELSDAYNALADLADPDDLTYANLFQVHEVEEYNEDIEDDEVVRTEPDNSIDIEEIDEER